MENFQHYSSQDDSWLGSDIGPAFTKTILHTAVYDKTSTTPDCEFHWWALMEECCKCMNEHLKAVQLISTCAVSVCALVCAFACLTECTCCIFSYS